MILSVSVENLQMLDADARPYGYIDNRSVKIFFVLFCSLIIPPVSLYNALLLSSGDRVSHLFKEYINQKNLLLLLLWEANLLWFVCNGVILPLPVHIIYANIRIGAISADTTSVSSLLKKISFVSYCA
jgi:hypothetical protein